MTCIVGMIGLAQSPFVIVNSSGSWSLASVEHPSGTRPFTPSQISCPTAEHCVAAGSLSPSTGPGVLPAVAVSNDGGRTWQSETIGGEDGSSLNAISCPSLHECFAAGSLYGSGVAQVLTSKDGGQQWTATSTTGPIGEIDDLACRNEVDCVGAGSVTRGGALAGVALMTTTDGGIHWSSNDSSTTPDVAGLACPGPRRCVLVGSTGILLSDGPIAQFSIDGISWHSTDLNGLNMVRFSSLSCAPPALCVAIGRGRGFVGSPDNAIQAGAILTSSNAGRSWVASKLPRGFGSLQTVACAASGFCVAGATSLSGRMWRLITSRPKG